MPTWLLVVLCVLAGMVLGPLALWAVFIVQQLRGKGIDL